MNTPVSNPPTAAVPVTSILLPAADGRRLIEEWRPRTTPAAAVQEVLADSHQSPRPDVEVRPGALIGAVIERADEVTVDFATPGRPAASDREAELQGQALVQTIGAYLGADKPVRTTLEGRPAALFGPSSERLVARPVRTEKSSELDAPESDTTVPGPLSLVGRAAASNRSITWYLNDPVSNETRYQGVAVVDPTTRVYAFSVAGPVGDDNLQIQHRVKDGNSLTGYAVTVR